MVELNKESFKESISKESLVVVDFFADWCMPCKMLKPIMERIEEKFTDVKFYKVDISINEELAKQQKIFSVLTLVAYKLGKAVKTLVGLNSFEDISNFIEKIKE